MQKILQNTNVIGKNLKRLRKAKETFSVCISYKTTVIWEEYVTA